MKINENNQVSVIGEISSSLTFSHKSFGEEFYMTDVAVKRLSGDVDRIPVMISDRMLDDVQQDYRGRTIAVAGDFRSYNRHDGSKSHLVLYVFAQKITFMEEELTDYTKTNRIFLDGYICKKPVYRMTPLGQREIADILLAVNRPYGKTDYIPCIAWGRNARYTSSFEVGTRVRVCGRVQSREYIKKLSETESEVRVAYEVSISGMEELDEEPCCE